RAHDEGVGEGDPSADELVEVRRRHLLVAQGRDRVEALVVAEQHQHVGLLRRRQGRGGNRQGAKSAKAGQEKQTRQKRVQAGARCLHRSPLVFLTLLVLSGLAALGALAVQSSTRPRERTPSPFCLVAESPRSLRAPSASFLRRATTSGCFADTSVFSPTSFSR